MVLVPNEETRAGRHFYKSLTDMDNLPDGSEDEGTGSDDELRQIGSAVESEDESVERKHKPAYIPPEDIVLGDKWVLRDVKVDPEAHQNMESEAGSDAESRSESGDREDEEEDREESARTALQDVSCVDFSRPFSLTALITGIGERERRAKIRT